MTDDARLPSTLESTKTVDIARALSDLQIDVIKNHEEMGDGEVARALQALRDAAWSGKAGNNKALFEKTLAQFSGNSAEQEKKRELLISSYARMGQLYEIAALTARDNFFKEKPNAGAVSEFIAAHKDADAAQLVAQLNQPVFEVTMTMHPTNVNSLRSMKAQRAISLALKNGNTDELKKAVEHYQTMPVLHQVKDDAGVAHDANLTVRDETLNVLNYLENIYTDLPGIYQKYDAELGKKDGYKPEDLKLGIKLGAWGSSGDKDGNGNVTAETTLEAIALHTKAILDVYAKEIGELPALAAWKETILTAQKRTEPVLAKIESLRKDNEKLRKEEAAILADEKAEGTPLTERRHTLETARKAADLSNRFDTLSAELAAIRTPLDAGKFVSDIEAEYASSHDAKTLELLRKARIFGFNFSKIEYRETAEEYSRVIGEILPGYKELSSEQKAKNVVALLENPPAALSELPKTLETLIPQDDSPKIEDRIKNKINAVRLLIEKHAPELEPFEDALATAIPLYRVTPQEKRAKLETALAQDPAAITHAVLARTNREGAGRAYNPDDALPIAYHTFKRMQLARDFPDMIKDNVLAECGQLDKLHPTPEQTQAQGVANLLEAQFLQRAVDADGKRALMGIVPLFEEPDTMKQIDKIMGAAYNTPAYRTHMEEVAGGKNVTQQVQIAHSDNARRSGLQAARAFIHEAHEKIRELNERSGVNTQFFEGGSMSDPYRNGVRSMSRIIDDFGLHDFTKFTFQGGDLLTYFNDPRSTERMFTRTLTHQANSFAPGEQGWSVNRQRDPKKYNRIAELVSREALKATLPEYDSQDFHTGTMGGLLHLLGYHDEVRAGGKGSRPGKRAKALDGADAGREVLPVDIIKGVRTIGFSEAMQHNALVPTWIGALRVGEHVKEAILEMQKNPTPQTEEFFKEFGPVSKDEMLTAQQLKYLYTMSPCFKDAQDRAAFGIAMTDMDKVEAIVNKEIVKARAKLEEKKNPYKGKANEGIEASKALRAIAYDELVLKSAEGYLGELKLEYQASARLSYAARTGKEMPVNKPALGAWTGAFNNIWERMTTDALPHIKDDIYNKRGYRDFLLHIKEFGGKLNDHLSGVLHAAGDTVMHGRWLAADDPAYGMHLSGEEKRRTQLLGQR